MSESLKRILRGLRSWLFVALALVALLEALFQPGSGSNWELMRTAVSTTIAGGDPYLPSAKQLVSAENLSWPYNPIWLPPVAALVVMVPHQLVLFALFGFGLWLLPRAWEDRWLTGFFGLSLYGALWSGNVSVIEFVGLCWLFRRVSEQRDVGPLLGVLSTMKLLPITFVAGLHWKSALRAVGVFAVLSGVGVMLYPEYFRCVAGLQNTPSVASELTLTGMNNQAVYQHGWFVAVPVAGVILWAVASAWNTPGRLPVLLMGLVLLWPRIPPHAYFAYMAVPVLAVYQTCREPVRWVLLVLWVLTAGLLVLRHAGAAINPCLQYLGALLTFLILSIENRFHAEHNESYVR